MGLKDTNWVVPKQEEAEDYITRFGPEVKRVPTLDSIRNRECLCHRCKHLVIGGKDKEDENCPIAQSFYEICKITCCAFILTRCPNFEDKEG